jgi:hypothetical protein
MTKDDIIRMAREAGLEQTVSIAPDGSSRIVSCPPIEPLERFATLVAAAEREACVKVAEDMGNIDGNMNKTWRNGCFDAAFAIRERGVPALERLNKAAEDNGEPL